MEISMKSPPSPLLLIGTCRFKLRMNEASLRNVDETDLTCYPSSSKSSLKQCPNAVRRPIPDYPSHKNSPFGDKRDTRSSHHNTPDYLLL